MKKRLSMLVIIALIVTVFSPASAMNKSSQSSIDVLISPYQAAIDRVNRDFDCVMYIPEETRWEVYNNIKDTSVDEFEKDLRLQIAEEMNTQRNDNVRSVPSEMTISDIPLDEGLVGDLPNAIPSENVAITLA